jgi:hypothetical protein
MKINQPLTVVVSMFLLLFAAMILVPTSASADSSSSVKVTKGTSQPNVYPAPEQILPSKVLPDVTPDVTTAVPANAYSTIGFPSAVNSGGGAVELYYVMSVNNVPNLGSTDYFWANQFGFKNVENETPGDGAYIGLQGINKMVFSVFSWDSPEYTSGCQGYASGFDGNPDQAGTSCVLNYTVTQGDTYVMEIKLTGSDSNGNDWTAEVLNYNTQQLTTIATINIPSSWGLIDGTNGTDTAFSEYFASPSQYTVCPTTTQSDVTFSDFNEENFLGNTYGNNAASLFVQQNTCSPYTKSQANSYTAYEQIIGTN